MTAREGESESRPLSDSPEAETKDNQRPKHTADGTYRQANSTLQELIAAVSANGGSLSVSGAAGWGLQYDDLHKIAEYIPLLEQYDPAEVAAEVEAKHNGTQLPQTLLAAALDYAKRGWYVFPIWGVTEGVCDCGKACEDIGKHPITAHGFKDATLDVGTIEGWWARRPHANVGIETGKRSGISVFDIDPGKGGQVSLDKLIAEHGPLPATPQVATGGGGSHHYFRYPADIDLKRSISKVGPGLDACANGGYVVAPPGSHESGGVYSWVTGPDEVTLADWPAWLVPAKTNGAAPPRAEGEIIPHGARNATLFSLASSLRARGLSEEAIEAALLVENENCCKPPLSIPEVEKLARQAGKYEQGEVLERTGGVMLLLPSALTPITESAKEIFAAIRIRPNQTMFIRSNHIVEFEDGKLCSLLPAAFCSRVEQYGSLFKLGKDGNGTIIHRPSRCSEANAKVLMLASEAQEILPRIEAVSNAPVCVERDGKAVVLGKGYHEDARLLVIGGEMPPVVPLRVAVRAILAILAEFDFATPGDKSRAIASILTPGMKMGGLLGDEYGPVDIAEADNTQAGKGYRCAMTHTIYGEERVLVTKNEGGVGSFDESLQHALLSGRMFVVPDNIRGMVNSQYWEAVITSPAQATARVPYRGYESVDVSRVTFQMTSNGAQTTKDLANRSCITRTLKREGFPFKKYKEGFVLNHIKAKQPFYLGCVYVYREWLRLGKPTTDELRHDFRVWVQSLDWIVRNLFDGSPLMDGHEQLKDRVSNPALSWARQLCLAMSKEVMTATALSASEIFEFCEADRDLLPPGSEDVETKDGALWVGKQMKHVFRGVQDTKITIRDPESPDDVVVVKEAVLVLEGFEILRQTKPERDPETRNIRNNKRYWIYAEGEGAKVGAEARAMEPVDPLHGVTLPE